MVKHVFVFPIIGSEVEAMRFYLRYHSKEVVRMLGPWLTRYETFRGHDPPPEAARYGAVRGLLTELWYRSVEEWKEAAPYSRPYTQPQGGWSTGLAIGRGAVTMVPAMPTEDFLGKEPTPEERPILRWYQVLKYPDGVSLEDGEKWYLETHSQEAKEQPGLLRYVGFKVPANVPFPTPWHRVVEMWYEDIDAWRRAVIHSPPKYTPPPWRKEQPFFDMMSIFAPYKPTIDFLRDNPLIP